MIERAFAFVSVALVLCSGCRQSTVAPAPPATAESALTEFAPTDPPSSRTHRFHDNWGSGLGCEPHGDVLTLHGTIRIAPFRKGTNGALLETDDGETWVLSYRAQDPLLQLDGARVEARGRACDKQGEALVGKHFDLHAVVERAP